VAQHTIIVESASQPAAQRKRRKAPLILAGIGLIALVPVVGSTFAANIGLNSGNDIEFGQGSQQTVTCDDSITVTPNATYDAGTDTWSLGIDVSDIQSDYCLNKTFTVAAWGGTGTTNTKQQEWTFTLSDENGTFTGGSYTLAGSAYTAALTSSLDAANLKTITIESSN
jgi:hypothetical protein